MKVNFAAEIQELDGTTAFYSENVPLTLGRFCAVLLRTKGDQTEDGIASGMLAIRIWSAEKIDVTPEELVLLRSAVKTAKPRDYAARAWQMLNPEG